MNKKILVIPVALGLFYYLGAGTLKSETLKTETADYEKQDFASGVSKKSEPIPQAKRTVSSQQANEPGPINTSAQALLPTVKVDSLLQAKAYVACFEKENCKYPQTDPKSYLLGLNKDVAAFIKNLSAASFRKDPRLQEFLREFMRQGDGFTQFEVLAVFAALPVSAVNLSAILEGAKNNYADPLIMEKVMTELVRYQGTLMADQVRDFIEETLVSGPQYSAEAAAKSLRQLLTKDNLNYYRSLVERSQSLAVKASLKSSINDFETSLRGG